MIASLELLKHNTNFNFTYKEENTPPILQFLVQIFNQLDLGVS